MPSFRLSRLSHPRATMLAAILLALVLLTFGAVAESAHHTVTPGIAAEQGSART